MHAGESTHLDEGFGPDSGAHLQDDTGFSLQEPNMTLQLPALHQGARLQEHVRHTLKTRPHVKDEATCGGVSIARSAPPSGVSSQRDLGPMRINLAAHLERAESFLKLNISAAVSIFGTGVSTNLWSSPDHTQSVLMSICAPA